MVKKITLLVKILVLVLSFVTPSQGIELKIIPLKKPILDENAKKERNIKNIIKPKNKPLKTLKKETITKKIDGQIIPLKKPLKIKKKLIKKKLLE